MGKDFSKAGNSDKLYELTCELEQTSKENDLLWIKEKLLGAIIDSFMKKEMLKQTSKRQTIIEFYVSVYSPEYNQIAVPYDSLCNSGGHNSFENEYYIHLEFIENNDRDSNGDPKYTGVKITWDYEKYLEKIKQNQESKIKVLSKSKK